MATKKKSTLQFSVWTREELAFLKEHATKDPTLKATELAEMFQRKYPKTTRTFKAIEHRVYKMRRQQVVAPRRSLVVPAVETNVSPNGHFTLTLPTGAVISGTREQVLGVLHSLHVA